MHAPGDYVDEKHDADSLKRYPQYMDDSPYHFPLHCAFGLARCARRSCNELQDKA
jgi:hypothetical protein